MRKFKVIFIFLMVGIFYTATLAINNIAYSQNFQRGQLNKIELNTEAAFKVDILGSGMEQTFKITQDPNYTKETLTVSQQGKTLKTFTNLLYGLIGPSMSPNDNRVIFMGGNWYAAYLRNNDIPDIIYYFVDGRMRFIQNLIIIGKTKTGDIDILFDLKPYLEKNGYGFASRELSINGTQLVVRNDSGHKILIDWDGNKFTSNVDNR